ncbi:MAG: alpha/beta fold hydrolase [bacterium]|nr:alpha/beta fold hydrolase [bacterium]
MTVHNMRRWALLSTAMAAGAYLLFPRALSRALAPPQPDADQSPSDLGLPEEQVWLDSASGTRLHGWFIPVGGQAPAVIVLHGWGGNAAVMLPLAPHLHEAGFHALFLDARNHGFSEHDSFTSMPRFAEDLDVAAEWLRARDEVTSIGVVGHSVGAGAAILSASRTDRLEAVVSVASFAHPNDIMRRQMAKVPGPVLTVILGMVQRIIGYEFDDFAPRNRISRVAGPVLLVHGDADSIVPLDNLYELAAAHPEAELLVVPDGDHSDLAPFEPHVGDITDFLSRHLDGEPEVGRR